MYLLFFFGLELPLQMATRRISTMYGRNMKKGGVRFYQEGNICMMLRILLVGIIEKSVPYLVSAKPI